MGVYNTYIKATQEASDEIEFTPDESFAGIMETVISIHEMDQKLFDSLLEVDMMELYLNEGDEETADEAPAETEDKQDSQPKEKKSFGNRLKNIGEVVKKAVKTAIEAIKKAVGNFIQKIKDSVNDKAFKAAEEAKKSGKLNGFKTSMRVLKDSNKDFYGFLDSKEKEIMGKFDEGFKILRKDKFSGSKDAVSQLNDNLTKDIAVNASDLYETKTDVEITAATLDNCVKTIKEFRDARAVKDIAKQCIKNIEAAGKKHDLEFVMGRFDNPNIDALAAASQKLVSALVKSSLKVQKAAIEMSVIELKNARSVIFKAYAFTKKGKTEEAPAEAKAKEEKEEAKTESVGLDSMLEYAIMESSDMYIDAVFA